MFTTRTSSVALAAAVLALTLPTVALAANSRSWVSSGGSDANPCTRSQPCATLNKAVAETVAGGEVNAVDSGGDYGGPTGVTIDKSITIDLRSVHAGFRVLNFFDTVGISAGATDKVTLRGLAINGSDGYGVTVNQVGTLG